MQTSRDGGDGIDMTYTVLSPWAAVETPESTIFSPRITELEGKTIGLFSIFKKTSPIVLAELGKFLKQEYPGIRLKEFQYPRDTEEIEFDTKYEPRLRKWLSDVDLVISGYGDAGSCAMYMAINTAYIEKLGVPTVAICRAGLWTSAMQGASSHFMPNLRLIELELQDLSMVLVDQHCIEDVIRPAVLTIKDEVVRLATAPMTKKEQPVKVEKDPLAAATFTGTLDEINTILYRHGWTNGTPVVPPTREKVDEILQGTDLKPDEVIGRIPPRMGIATVEKIAVNAVMAGCLPTHLPAVIAAVEAMLDPAIHVVGWTCSVRSWMGPFITINGPARLALGMETGSTFMAGYKRAASSIARAVAYCIMNIGGVRPKLEDNAFLGGECRFGVCFAEDEENSPWKGHQTDFGFKAEDSTVSLFWPVGRQKIISAIEHNDPESILEKLCIPEDIGFVPGCMYVLTPPVAKALQDYGMSKKDVIDYIVEYARRDISPEYLRWVTGNNHIPKGVPVPANTRYNVRKYWNKDHICIIVGGSDKLYTGSAFVGGGDHGGPVCAKMKLPKKWNSLVKKYKDMT